MTLSNFEDGVDKAEYECKAKVDRVATTGTTWLGLTVGCAECHTHKYDPISHREFYQLYAFFNNTTDHDLPAPTAEELAAYNQKHAAWEMERIRLEAPIEAYLATILDTKLPEWERGLTLPAARWTPLKPDEVTFVTEDEERTIPANEDHSITTGARDPERTRYLVKATVSLKGVTGFR